MQPEHKIEVEASSWIRNIKHGAHTVCFVQFATIVGLEGALFVSSHVLQLGATARPPVDRLQPRQGRVVVRTRHRRHCLDRLLLVSKRSNGRPEHVLPPGWVGQAGQKAALTVEVFIVIRLTSLRVLLGVLRILLRVIKLELAASRCAPVRSTALRQPGRNPARFGLRLGAGRRVGYSAGVPAFRNREQLSRFYQIAVTLYVPRGLHIATEYHRALRIANRLYKISTCTCHRCLQTRSAAKQVRTGLVRLMHRSPRTRCKVVAAPN